MSDTTSIMDLPTDPTGGGNVSNNITISANEKLNNANDNNNNNISLDQTTISQIVNSLQQASITGATQLQSRDIPMSSIGHTQDPYVQPNYVPQVKSNNDYIKNDESNEDIILKNTRNTHVLDEMYNEIQTPLLLAVLYFLFQLPFFRTKQYIYLPILFSVDGSVNVNGYIFNSVLFGLIFYMLNKITTLFGKF